MNNQINDHEYKDENPNSNLIIDNDDGDTPKKKTHYLGRITAILLILIIVTYVGLNFSELSLDNSISYIKTNIFGIDKGNGFPYNINGTKINNNNIKKLGANIIYLSDTSCTAINNTAGEVFFLQHGYNNPAIVAQDNKCIIYGIKSKSFMIINKDFNVKKFDIENDIFTVDLNKNGFYATVTGAEDYLSTVSLYSPDNKLIYERNFVDYYITDVTVNDDNKNLAFSGIYVDNGKINTKIMLAEISQKDLTGEYVLEDSVIADIEYLNNGNIVCVGDKYSEVINPSLKKTEKISYNSMLLSNVYIDKNSGFAIALAYNENDKNSKIIKIDGDGKVIFDEDVMHNVRDIAFDDKYIYALSSENVVAYDSDGKKYNSVKSDVNSRSLFLNGKNELYIIAENKIINADIFNLS